MIRIIIFGNARAAIFLLSFVYGVDKIRRYVGTLCELEYVECSDATFPNEMIFFEKSIFEWPLNLQFVR